MQQLVPGGGSTYSKRVNAFHEPTCFPAFAMRGEGAYLIDVDGNRYLDFVAGLAPILIGYNDRRINEAIVKQLQNGVLYSLPSPLEIDLAEKIVEIIPNAEMVKLFKTGAEATSGAVRTARLVTGREKILSCGYHGWHDWWSVNSSPAGIPACLNDLTLPVPFNDLASAERLMVEHGDTVAAIIATPAIYGVNPAPGFLEGLRRLADRYGALLIFDEIITGFRFGVSGAQSLYNVDCDLAVFAKAIANGMPIAVLTGKRDVMEPMSRSWVTSTYAGETLSLAAALATIEILQEGSIYEHLSIVASHLHGSVQEVCSELNVDVHANDILNALRFDFLPATEERGLSASQLIENCARRGVLLRREGDNGVSLCLIAAMSENDVDFALETISCAISESKNRIV